MVAKTRPYEESIRQKSKKTGIKARCIRCDSVLFIVTLGFWSIKHGIKVKCRNCGLINEL